jgi:uncharacterized protein YwqG
MWSNAFELTAALEAAGLRDWAPRLAERARPCIILAPGAIEDGVNVTVGVSRLGGEPDLPADLTWPVRPPLRLQGQSTFSGAVPLRVLLGSRHWAHRLLRTQRWKQAVETWQGLGQAETAIRNRSWPLSFVAQIDFGELHAVHALEGFPAAGRLWLFCDPFDWPWGERQDQARTRAIYAEVPAERLRLRPSPPEFAALEAKQLMPRGFRFKPRPLHPTAWLLPPPLGSCDLGQLARQAPEAVSGAGVFLAYQRFWRELFAGQPRIFGPAGDTIHQVGGRAFPIQEAVEAECAKLAGDGAESADAWQLVLQVDSDIEAGMEWGDVGRLYLCLRRHDLAACRFDRCWLLMQCY